MIDPLSLLKGLGAHGSTATVPILAGMMLFTPIETYNQHVAENERGYILDLVGKAGGVEAGAYKDSLCRALEEALARLCAVSESDAICQDREMFRDQAGC